MIDRRSLQGALLLSACFLSTLAHADAYDDQLRRRELDTQDQQLQAVYTQIMGMVDADQQREVQSAERDWLRWRDKECGTGDIGGDRAAWLDQINADFAVWNCVYSATMARRMELEREVDAALDPVYPSQINPRSRFAKWHALKHDTGRWYFEVTVDRGKIARTAPTDVYLGFLDDENVLTGVAQPVKADEAAAGVITYGLAVDIDAGRAYHSENGAWHEAVPGSTAGAAITPKKPYSATARTRDQTSRLILAGALKANFGDEPFRYRVPAGYRGWRDTMCEAPQNSREIGVCYGKELADADKALNDVYAAVTLALDAGARQQLRSAQRAWISRRDRECGIKNSRGDHEIWLRSVLQDADRATCVLRLTRARVDELRHSQPAATAQAPAIVAAPAPAVSAQVPVPRGSTACGFADLQLPKDFALFASGNYGGKPSGFQIDQSGHEATRMDVRVNKTEKPVVLMLGAYEPTIWNVSWSAGTRIVAVLVSGYHRQAIAGLDPKVPVLNSSYDNKGSCGYFYVSERNLEKLNPLARRVFGRDVDLVYLAEKGDVLVGDPPASGARWQTSTALTVESFYDKNAPIAGPAGLADAARRGLLRSATRDDAQAWVDAVAAATPPSQQLPQIAGKGPPRPPLPSLFRAYVVLKPFVFPAGLYGGNSATFFIPKGLPKPTGDSGHSTVYDFNTVGCTGAGCSNE